MSWGIIYWNCCGWIISYVLLFILDDEINGWKLRGGLGSMRMMGCILWNFGIEGNLCKMYVLKWR